MDNLLILIGRIEEGLAIRVLNLALGANPVLADLALEVRLDEVTLVEVTVAAAADEGLVIDLV
jgi:hypothetical protein